MCLKPSPTHTSRSGGCTLTGALSVTTHIRNAASVIHGPRGCAHHNFSLLHATQLDNEKVSVPDIVSSALGEGDIVFGGEEALARTLEVVCDRDVAAVFVLSTCVVATIGDDIAEVCSRDWGVQVIPVPTAGFLGGTFQDGVNNALLSLADSAEPCEKTMSVNIIGEKNLEYEVGENYAEVARLLSLLGLPVGIRFVHDLSSDKIRLLGAARLNILRDPALVPVGNHLLQRFGTPYIESFPAGFSDTLAFISAVAASCGRNPERALEIEQSLQAEILSDFADIHDAKGVFTSPVMDSGSVRAAQEAADALNIRVGPDEQARPLPVQPVVGTSGIRRMLHRWRRAIHA
ncbi:MULTISPECIES: nitrogenase component 1 [unclassified Methanoregula]|uniref:nitrogenase component 1 n=1 Tax=unclassified Methanoregula TaxID=2649730 RepID=UPI0009C4D879|nr:MULTISPECIES: nitrogenase component 1 [unclassified Methanoregula]OPX64922.1 MAG: light-independent protochlorophyllide reductase subunit B [Methanoregula sp. PtaB.Bin085]OPY32974.1 MAG: light-independent protochlorophyllide reductase subunit B [Methanoregula sp. PtaU1.Bin006]